MHFIHLPPTSCEAESTSVRLHGWFWIQSKQCLEHGIICYIWVSYRNRSEIFWHMYVKQATCIDAAIVLSSPHTWFHTFATCTIFLDPGLVFHVVYHRKRCSRWGQIDANYSGTLMIKHCEFLRRAGSDKTYQYLIRYMIPQWVKTIDRSMSLFTANEMIMTLTA